MSHTRDFQTLKTIAHGMLPKPVYEQLYLLAKEVPESLSIMELGTGHGAGTAALAWGRIDGAYSGYVYTLDKMEGGSRARYGDADTNKRIADQAFEYLGVGHVVRPIWQDALTFYQTSQIPASLGLLFIDMDGKIDRDLKALWPNMEVGCRLVIDDFELKTRVQPRGLRGHVHVDAKHRLTYEMVSRLEGVGLIERETVVGNTWIGFRASNMPFHIANEEIIEAYRTLVHMPGRIVVPGNRIARMLAPRWLRKRLAGRS